MVALDLLLGRSDRAAALLSAVDVYPAGMSLRLLMLVAGELGDVDPGLFGAGRPGRNADAEPQRALCFGVQFSDGARATNLGCGSPGEPNGSVRLIPRGGGGGGGRAGQELWLWPLPPAGPLTLVCRWQEAGIDQTTVDIDAALLRDAATRARRFFDDLPPAPDLATEGWSSYTRQAMPPV